MRMSEVQETNHFASVGIEPYRPYHAIRSTDFYLILWLTATHHHIHIDHPAVNPSIDDAQRGLERNQSPEQPFLQNPFLRPRGIVALLAAGAVVFAAVITRAIIVAADIIAIAIAIPVSISISIAIAIAVAIAVPAASSRPATILGE